MGDEAESLTEGPGEDEWHKLANEAEESAEAVMHDEYDCVLEAMIGTRKVHRITIEHSTHEQQEALRAQRWGTDSDRETVFGHILSEKPDGQGQDFALDSVMNQELPWASSATKIPAVVPIIDSVSGM